MRLLVVTWDGAGNLPPILSLIHALVLQGHAVDVLAHDVQKSAIEGAGGVFLAFNSARQIDHGLPLPLGENPMHTLIEMDQDISRDVLAAVQSRIPDALLVDCMLPATLREVSRTNTPSVALVHALYGVFMVMGGGAFRSPIDEATLALGFTYASLDDASSVPPNYVFVGPAKLPTRIAPYTRQRSDLPFVVASLSTGLQGRPGTQHALLQRICDALTPLDIEALVTTGRGIATESLTAGALTVVVRSAPHESVLPSADLFITHAGHGSIVAGLCAGTPMLCLPPGADQPFNAARIAQLGCGEVLDVSSSPSVISETVLRMINDTGLHTRARDFASIVESHAGIDLAVARIEALAARPH